MTGPIERAFTEVFGHDNTSGKAIVRVIDHELAALHQRIDKMEADNANMDGLRAMDDAIARKRAERKCAGTVFWAPVTTYDPPVDTRTVYLLALPSGDFCLGWRRDDGTWTKSFCSDERGSVAATHFARLEGPER